MKKKQFKAESKKLLDLMINSIYTNKDIFLREIISNASDAIDKAHYKSLTDKEIKLPKELSINISIDKDNRTITVSDTGIGMSEEELDNNLGTIAESGSSLFKQDKEDTNIIGQFGVGFYSTFMVAKKVEVITKPYGSSEANTWRSTGEDGYTIEKCNKDKNGTDIVITLKDDTDDFKYSDYLEEYKIKELVSKYSNFIRYPIKLSGETINEMTPLWKKDKKKIKDEDYNNFYMSKFYDYNNPLKVINYKAEGNVEFNALLFIPSHAPFDFYSKNYKRGLELYSNGVLIMDNCEELLPEEYNFVKGVVDSSDLSLNISREILQQDKQVKLIAKNISKKINNELKDMLVNDRDNYDKFYKECGSALKIAIYNSFGSLKDELQDLLLFYSSSEEKNITLREYVDKIKDDQKKIYYAVGESISKINLNPKVDSLKDKGFEILYLTDYADEFVLQVLKDYDNKEFVNIENSDLDLDSEEEKKEIEAFNLNNKDLLDKITSLLDKKVTKVKFTNNLKNHPVCLATEGVISNGMEKIINAIPTEQNISSNKVLLINSNHKITNKLKDIYSNSPELLEKYVKLLYGEACLIEGLNVDNTNEISDIIFDLISE